MLYNIFGRMGQSLVLEMVYCLVEVENIVVIKEVIGSLEQVFLIWVYIFDDFVIYVGDDVLIFFLLVVGGVGVVSVVSYLVGDCLQVMVQYFVQGVMV